eukprot:GHVQ01018306.1.p2 GENE.GHVQ01018306.1~~GHVQ01018306.1.p2  ORF type:complete len:119 (-),score=24.02 GHVQ01018306.1:697-1053(-)
MCVYVCVCVCVTSKYNTPTTVHIISTKKRQTVNNMNDNRGDNRGGGNAKITDEVVRQHYARLNQCLEKVDEAATEADKSAQQARAAACKSREVEEAARQLLEKKKFELQAEGSTCAQM